MQIPDSVQKLLWEYSRDELGSGPKWERTVVERVMQQGCWDDMVWLLNTFDRSRLRSYLKERGRRALAPRELRFWSRICGVPSADQNEWVLEAREREKAWRG